MSVAEDISPPKRVAIIAGENVRARKSALPDLLFAELAKRNDVALVEREAIRDVLREHELALSGSYVNGADTVARLLNANLLLFVDQLSGGASMLRVLFVEARSSVIMGSEVVEAKPGPAALADVGAALSRSLQKTMVAESDRRHVAVLDFKSEEVTRDLDGLAMALQPLLEEAIGVAPSVVVLDRQHAQRLAEEADLTGLDLRLRTAATLVSGSIRRADNGVGYAVRLLLASSRSPEPMPRAFDVPTDVVPELVQTIAEAVLRQIHAKPGRAFAAEDEATRLARRVGPVPRRPFSKDVAIGIYLPSHFRQSGVSDRAEEYAEAAYALSPTLSNLLRAAYYTSGVRSSELFYRYWQKRVQDLRGREVNIDVPNVFTFPMSKEARDATRKGIRGFPSAEEIVLQRETLKLELAVRATDTKRPGLWWSTLSSASGALWRWSPDHAEWGRYLRDLVTLYLAPPEAVGARRKDALSFLGALVRNTCSNTSEGERFGNAINSQGLNATLAWMRTHNDPSLTLVSHMIRVTYRGQWGDAEAARAALDHVVEKLPLAHPDRNVDRDRCLVEWVYYCVTTIECAYPDGYRNPEAWFEIKKYMSAIIDPIVEAGDISRLVVWLNYQPNKSHPPIWTNILDKHMSKDEALQWLQGVVDRLQKHVRSGNIAAIEVEAASDIIQTYEAHIAQLKSRELALPDAWSHYTLERLPIQRPSGSFATLQWMTIEDGILWLVWRTTAVARRKGEDPLRLTAASVSLSGDPLETFGPVQMTAAGGHRTGSEVSGSAFCGGRMFVGTQRHGLAVFARDGVRVWTTENGLPAPYISSLAACGKSAYFWVSTRFLSDGDGDGALIRYDTARDTFTELFNTKRTDPRCALDGKQGAIKAMVADPEAECLWLAKVSGDSWLWRYDVVSSEATPAGRLSSRDVLSMSWDESRILIGYRPKDLGVYDPTAGEYSPLLSTMRRVPPRYGSRQSQSWPAVLVGDDLIVSDSTDAHLATATSGGHSFHFGSRGSLSLYSDASSSPSVMQYAPDGEPPNIRYIVKLDPNTAILATRDGKFWKLRRKKR